jgi:hypothetical protein
MQKSIRAARLVAYATLLVLVAGGTAAAQPGQGQGDRHGATLLRAQPLPLGPDDLPEERTTRRLEPGLVHTKIVRGHSSDQDRWTVTVGFASTAAERDALAAQLEAAGFEPRADPAAERAPDGSILGWMVRTGAFVDMAEAQALAAQVVEAGLPASVQNTAEDGGYAEGPWVVNVLTVDPRRYRGELSAALATGIVPDKETTSSIAARLGATAAINGGFYVVNETMGTPGDLAGISVLDGELVSEAIKGRPALILPHQNGRGASVDRVTTPLQVRAEDGAQRRVDGLNRKPGLIFNCGGVDDEPFDRPAHDYVCRDAEEIIVVTPVFGETADAGTGFQVTLDRRGVVTARQGERGGPIPEDGMLVQATGESASWLSARAPLGSRLRISQDLRDERGRRVRLTPRTDMVNGGPTLVQRGRVALHPVREGWSPEDIESTDRGGFYNGWYVRRNPRTAAGIGRDGILLLVTVDGRQPGYSIGTSIRETARLMEYFDSQEAINLDGGGSTTMVVRDELQGRPSDPTGERANGDALVLLPRSKGTKP